MNRKIMISAIQSYHDTLAPSDEGAVSNADLGRDIPYKKKYHFYFTMLSLPPSRASRATSLAEGGYIYRTFFGLRC